MTRSLVAYTDGGSRGNPGPAGYGAVITDARTGQVLAQRSEYLGEVSNNVAEYRGVLAALEACALIDADAQVEVRADSKLVVEQLSGRWKIKHPDMKELAQRAKQALPHVQVTYTWVPRAQNTDADALANRAMDTRASFATDAWQEADSDAGGTPPAADGTRDSDDARDSDSAPAPDDAQAPDDAPATESTPATDSAPATDAGHAAVPEEGPDAVEGPDTRPLVIPSGRPEGTPATLVLVRHGVTEHTLSRRMAGGDVPGPDLSAAGRAQAMRAARLLERLPSTWHGIEPPSRLLTSPLVRTRATADIIAHQLGLDPQEDERLEEVYFGQWCGELSSQVQEQDGQAYRQFISTGTSPAPGGESLVDVARRMGSVMSEIAQHHTGQTTIAVSHSVASRCALGLALAADPSRWWMLRIPPASVSVLRLWPATDPEDGPEVEVVATGVPSELIGDAEASAAASAATGR